MSNLIEKLNIQIGESECLSQESIIFSFQNLTKRFFVDPNLVEEALNDAGYYDYTRQEIGDLCSVIDNFGENLEPGEILEKAIWFDKNL